MTRTILFRGLAKSNNQWVQGSLSIEFGRTYIRFEWDDDSSPSGPGIVSVEVHPDSVGQATGLLDKNGKMIFDGSIVSITINKGLPSEYTGNWEVYFGTWCYMRKHPIWSSFSFDKAQANQCEIIGNIHDNQELLNP